MIALQVILPIVIFLLMYCITIYLDAQFAESRSPQLHISPCSSQFGSCFTIGYQPNTDPFVVKIMKEFAIASGLRDEVFRGFPSELEIEDFLFKRANSISHIFHFDLLYYCPIPSITPQPKDYTTCSNGTLLTNQTIDINYYIQYAIDPNYGKYRTATSLNYFLNKAISKLRSEFDVQISNSYQPSYSLIQLLQDFALKIFLYVALSSLIFLVTYFQLNLILSEKKVRIQLTAAGLHNSIYWLSLFVMFTIINAIYVIPILGLIRISMSNIFEAGFTKVYLIFFLYFEAVMPFALFLTTIFRQSITGATKRLWLIIILTSFLGDYAIYGPDTVKKIMIFFPTKYLIAGIVKISNVDSKLITILDEMDSIGQLAMYLVYLFLAYSAAFLYVDYVINLGNHPLFFLLSSFWLSFRRVKNLTLEIPDHAELEFVYTLDDFGNPVEPAQASNSSDGIQPSAHSIVLVENLQKFFRSLKGLKIVKTPVLKGVSFTIERNQIVGLLGLNGAGKSTIMSIMVGSLSPSDGKVTIAGYDLMKEKSGIRKITGYCSQQEILWPELTPREHMEAFGRVHGLYGEALESEIETMLAKVRLSDVSDDVPVREFSGGMQRRLSVAISMVASPQILYMDEPTTGVDFESRLEVWSMITEAKETASVLLTTHSMEEAAMLCDKLVLLKDGKIVVTGSPMKLLSDHSLFLTVNIQTIAENETIINQLITDLLNHKRSLINPPISVGSSHGLEDSEESANLHVNPSEFITNMSLLIGQEGINAQKTDIYALPLLVEIPILKRDAIYLPDILNLLETNRSCLNISSITMKNPSFGDIFIDVFSRDTNLFSKEDHQIALEEEMGHKKEMELEMEKGEAMNMEQQKIHMQKVAKLKQTNLRKVEKLKQKKMRKIRKLQEKEEKEKIKLQNEPTWRWLKLFVISIIVLIVAIVSSILFVIYVQNEKQSTYEISSLNPAWPVDEDFFLTAIIITEITTQSAKISFNVKEAQQVQIKVYRFDVYRWNRILTMERLVTISPYTHEMTINALSPEKAYAVYAVRFPSRTKRSYISYFRTLK